MFEVFIYLKKGFDTVNHEILLQKLKLYGINGLCLEWFKSYLSNRNQCISYCIFENIKKSVYLYILYLILCGSILGPLLFLIYVNDLYYCLEKLNFVIFTDDTSLLYSGINLYNLFSDMNCKFNKIFIYIKSKKLLLNLTKTFFKKKKRFFLNMDNIAIERENITKFLGILMKISHGNDVTTKISKSIGILYKSREIVQQPLLKQ